ncbi:hypothetical protein L873DRAFT_1441577 [Choiromyces venosus 120613-1]|uniref:Uncharacterized protein n=1 Tax=Choiromyces venosus 120613-1 TaxID=1336337 RepID=A0A3N4JAC6_9PEZI|nr:hypothetical protein L873DRAFT_1441577 [Choiromyces venosus 120613-1]
MEEKMALYHTTVPILCGQSLTLKTPIWSSYCATREPMMVSGWVFFILFVLSYLIITTCFRGFPFQPLLRPNSNVFLALNLYNFSPS